MSEPFRPYEKLVEISVSGKSFRLPERIHIEMFPVHQPRNDSLRAILLESGCQYCRVTCSTAG